MDEREVVTVPVGVLKRAARNADALAGEACARSHTDANIRREQSHAMFSAALRAAAAGARVDWSTIAEQAP